MDRKSCLEVGTSLTRKLMPICPLESCTRCPQINGEMKSSMVSTFLSQSGCWDMFQQFEHADLLRNTLYRHHERHS
jgi:hypothetical protein